MNELVNSLKKIAMDSKENWNEALHHRANNGQFTSGDGRGKTGGEKKDDKKEETQTSGKGDNGERSKGTIRAIISDAFRQTGGGLKSIKEHRGEFKVEISVYNQGSAYRKVNSLNAVLSKHSLKASIPDVRNYNALSIRKTEANQEKRSAQDGSEMAIDSGTHEGAIKAAQTRKLHGGGLYHTDKEIIDHGMFNLGDEDHNTEMRGVFKSGRRDYGMASKSFPTRIRDLFLEHARNYQGEKENVTTPESLSKEGYAITHGKRKGELKLMRQVNPSYGNRFNTMQDLQYSWRPIVPRAKPGTVVKKPKLSRVPYLDMSGTGMGGNNFETYIGYRHK